MPRDHWQKAKNRDIRRGPVGAERLGPDPTRADLEKGEWVYAVRNVNGTIVSSFLDRKQAEGLAVRLNADGFDTGPFGVTADRRRPFDYSKPSPEYPEIAAEREAMREVGRQIEDAERSAEERDETRKRYRILPYKPEAHRGGVDPHILFLAEASDGKEIHLKLQMTPNQLLSLVDSIMRCWR